MKLIIDLPDDAYEQVKETWTTYTQNYVVVSLYRAVKAGEPFEERPQGEWVEKHCDYGVYYRCSNCHKMPPNYECDYKEGAIKTNFCPNCGADMRGNKE